MEDIKKVQKLAVSLLEKFMEFCEENELTYYFIGGALIGVLRHEGFIPWDDDIDIGMPRKEYDKFIRLIKEKMPKGYGICDRYTDSNWHFAMSQFIDVESEIEIDLAEQKRIAHIWVDVFPVDGLPSNKIKRWFRVRHILMYRYLVQIANIKTQVDAQRTRPWYENVILGIAKKIPFHKLINTNKTIDKMEKLLRKCDFETSEYAGNMLGRYRQKEAVRKSCFGKPVKGMFEGIEVNIPENSHELQTALYGDYMKLPPEKDRVAHNVEIIKSREAKEN